MSGYKLTNGNDISTIFAAGVSPGVTTGYNLTNGNDISTIFAPGFYSGVTTGYKLTNGNDISTIFAPSITPLSVSGCCLWMDASDPTTVTASGGRVSQWKDKANNWYMLQANTSFQPYYNTTTKNGLNTMSFNSTTKTYLYGDTYANAFAFGTNSYYIFSVSIQSNASGYIFNKTRANVQNGRILYGRGSSQYFVSFIHTGGGSLGTTTSDTNTAYRLLSLAVNRTDKSDYVYQNGTAVVSYTYGTSDTTNYTNNGNSMLIGAYNNSSGTASDIVAPLDGFYLTGEIAEILCYASGDMVNATRYWIEGYLAWKWGIQSSLPSGHAYFASPPPPTPP